MLDLYRMAAVIICCALYSLAALRLPGNTVLPGTTQIFTFHRSRRSFELPRIFTSRQRKRDLGDFRGLFPRFVLPGRRLKLAFIMETKNQRTPAEIARESMKRLARQRIAPTPENFSAAYYDVGGERPAAHPAALLVKQFVRSAMRANPGNGAATAELESAIDRQDWQHAGRLVNDFSKQVDDDGSADWPRITGELIRNIDLPHAGWTPARKRESVQHVLTSFAADAQKAHEKLAGLIQSWSGVTTAGRVKVAGAEPASNPDTRDKAAATPAVVTTAAPAGGEENKLPRRAGRSEEAEACERLAGVLRLLCSNVGALAPDASWLKGQMERVDLLLTPPFNTKRLSEAESSLRAAVTNQLVLRDELEAVKVTIREILTTLIDRLGSVTQTTGDFYSRIGGYSEQIAKTDDLGSLHQLVKDLLGDTQRMQEDIRHTHDELVEARHKSENYAIRVNTLEQELSKVSEMVKTDQLTQALNRRGFDEAMNIELARAQRQDTPLCLAMLDLDNFKRLNDAHGHQAGDRALMHLTSVVREVIRPTDIVARLGGEEFVIVMPETSLDEAVAVVARLQRQLTRQFFLEKEEKLFITFSAGVAELAPRESHEEVLQRADGALYDAKRQGKNRVVAAAVPAEKAQASTRQARS